MATKPTSRRCGSVPGQTRCPGCLQGKPCWRVQRSSSAVPALASPVLSAPPARSSAVPALASAVLSAPPARAPGAVGPGKKSALGVLGRGQKRCPQCSEAVGTASKQCRRCDHEFAKRAPAKRAPAKPVVF